jgi:hypothetical protein
MALLRPNENTAFFAEREQVGIKATGRRAQVASDPRARLMYYLNCVCEVLEIRNEDFHRLTHHTRYAALSKEEEVLLLTICETVRPDVLVGRVFIPVRSLPDNSGNEFLEISAVHTSLVGAFHETQAVIIGGQETAVKKVMLFTKQWLSTNFVNAFQELRTRRRDAGLPSNRYLVWIGRIMICLSIAALGISIASLVQQCAEYPICSGIWCAFPFGSILGWYLTTIGRGRCRHTRGRSCAIVVITLMLLINHPIILFGNFNHKESKVSSQLSRKMDTVQLF